jgi:two-component system sensor histidine kinase KdpD
MILNVTDEGAGLTEAELPRIWHRFVRGGRTALETSGSGLGLWIAESFIAANGGKMSAISDGPGRGTTMAIELPVPQATVPTMESDRDE